MSIGHEEEEVQRKYPLIQETTVPIVTYFLSGSYTGFFPYTVAIIMMYIQIVSNFFHITGQMISECSWLYYFKMEVSKPPE